jgi:hypothetical protein
MRTGVSRSKQKRVEEDRGESEGQKDREKFRLQDK